MVEIEARWMLSTKDEEGCFTPEKRDLRLSQYEISTFRYRELKNYCLQHEEKKARLRALRGLKAQSLTGMPSGGGTSDPTMRNAVRAMMLEHDIRLVEECCKQAAPFAWQALLNNVTQAVPFEKQPDTFSGRRQFYEARRRFFFLLDQAKTDVKG